MMGSPHTIFFTFVPTSGELKVHTYPRKHGTSWLSWNLMEKSWKNVFFLDCPGTLEF